MTGIEIVTALAAKYGQTTFSYGFKFIKYIAYGRKIKQETFELKGATRTLKSRLESVLQPTLDDRLEPSIRSLKARVEGRIQPKFAVTKVDAQTAENLVNYYAALIDYVDVLDATLTKLREKKAENVSIDDIEIRATEAFVQRLLNLWITAPTELGIPGKSTDEELKNFGFENTVVAENISDRMRLHELANEDIKLQKNPTLNATGYLHEIKSKLLRQTPDFWPNTCAYYGKRDWTLLGKPKYDGGKFKKEVPASVKAKLNVPDGAIVIETYYAPETFNYVSKIFKGDFFAKCLKDIGSRKNGIICFVAENVDKKVKEFFERDFLPANAAVFCYDLNKSKLLYNKNSANSAYYAPYFARGAALPSIITYLKGQGLGRGPQKVFSRSDLTKYIRRDCIDDFIEEQLKRRTIAKHAGLDEHYEVAK